MTTPTKKYETEFTENAVCPHCGYENRDSWEYNLGDGQRLNVSCHRCSRNFVVEADVTTKYITTIPSDKEAK